MIPEKSRIRIEKYITGIVSKNASKLYAIYANPEHVHLLVSRAASLSEEELATIIANSSERFINENKLVPGIFRWQQSAAAFSVSKSGIDPAGAGQIYSESIRTPPRVLGAQEYDHFLKYYQEKVK
jgi:putative transposase